MARWKLMTPHYLRVPGEQWEYTETDRTTNRPRKMRLDVPRLLDPADKGCWTNRWGSGDNADGEIIVCHEGKGQPSDQVFFGDPSPDMVPFDDEAKAISESFAKAWSFRPDQGFGDFSQSMIDRLQAQMKPQEAPTIPGLSELVSAINGLVQAQQPAARRV